MLSSARLAFGQTSPLYEPEDCLCVGAHRPACAARPASAAIFLGRVVAIKHLPSGSADTVQFEVEEVFRGRMGPTTAVHVYQHHCPPFDIADPFEEGGEYVVYATMNPSTDDLQMGSDIMVNLNDEPGDDFPAFCTSKAVEMKRATEDLAYWRNYSRAPETGRVFGTAKERIRQLMFDNPSEEESFEMKPIVGQIVVVQNFDHSYTTKTDELGRYEVQSIAPGQYEVFPSGAEKNLFPAKLTVDIAAKGCAQVDFRRNDPALFRKKLRNR